MPLPTAYSEDALAQLVQDENSKFRSPRDLAKWCKNNETIRCDYCSCNALHCTIESGYAGCRTPECLQQSRRCSREDDELYNRIQSHFWPQLQRDVFLRYASQLPRPPLINVLNRKSDSYTDLLTPMFRSLKDTSPALQESESGLGERMNECGTLTAEKTQKSGRDSKSKDRKSDMKDCKCSKPTSNLDLTADLFIQLEKLSYELKVSRSTEEQVKADYRVLADKLVEIDKEHRAQLSSKNEDIERLQQTLRGLEQNHQAKVATIDREYQKQLSLARTDTFVQRSFNALEQKLQILLKEYATSNQERDALKRELALRNQENERLRADSGTRSGLCTTLIEELDNSQKQFEEVLRQNAEIRREGEGFHRSLWETRSELDALRQQTRREHDAQAAKDKNELFDLMSVRQSLSTAFSSSRDYEYLASTFKLQDQVLERQVNARVSISLPGGSRQEGLKDSDTTSMTGPPRKRHKES